MTALVLVPGLLCDADVWAPQLAQLRAVAQTLHIAEAGMLDDLGAMAEKILGEVDGPMALAGHSMGGRVALEVARRAPERVRALALLDTGCRPLPSGEVGERERTGRLTMLRLAETEGTRAMSAEWLQNMIHPERRTDAALCQRIIGMQGRRTAAHLAAQTRALLARPDASEVLASLRVPVLLLTGTHDVNSLPMANREMAALAADCHLEVLEHCGHMSTLEQPEAVLRCLLAWWSRAAPSA